MSIEARPPPPQFAARLKRALGGRAGWSGFVVQILFVAALVWIFYEIVANARTNLENQHITAGFGFLKNTAGFDVSQSLIPYSGSDTYTRVFFVGLLNTLLVSLIGIFFATLIGFLVALGRLSPNWLLSRISGGYVELVRNLPLLFQILFWYLAVLAALPGPRQSISLFGSFFLSNRGLIIPKPIGNPAFEPFVMAVAVAIAAAFLLWRYARRQLFQSGKLITIWPYVLGLLVGLPLVTALVFGAPVRFEFPELKGFATAARDVLLRVPGVEKAVILGDQPEKLYIDVSSKVLAERGISVLDIQNALSGQNNEARAELAKTARLNPKITSIKSLTPLDVGIPRLVDGLRKAGMPEE